MGEEASRKGMIIKGKERWQRETHDARGEKATEREKDINGIKIEQW
jgi:hypothetical protein